MRHVHEQPSNVWPRDMQINIELPTHLLTLLWIREAWGIASDVRLPALSPTPVVWESEAPAHASYEEWSRRWRDCWNRGWAWYSSAVPAMRLHSQVSDGVVFPSPPMWETRFGREGVDFKALWSWNMELQDHYEELKMSPERRALDALVAAWHSGIDSVIVLPYGVEFSQRITNRHLVVSKTTRDDPGTYASALLNSIGAVPRMIVAEDAGKGS